MRARRRAAGLMGCGLLAALACAGPAPRAPAPAPARNLDALPSDLIGRVQRYRTSAEDTLLDLAVQNDLGYVEIVAANPGVDPWLPGEGTDVLLPTAHLYPSGPRVGIIVNVPEQRLYYYPKKGEPLSFPIGIGREGFETPITVTKVVRKKKNPVWYPGPSARAEDPTLAAAVKPGPDNPLGAHAFYLAINSYLIHGTNLPYGVGRRSSRGCMRLYPQDIERLFDMVEVGTPVRIISEAVKLGWFRGDLYLEVHPSLSQATELEDTGHFTPAANPLQVDDRIRAAAGAELGRVDWQLVRKALDEARGIPVRITGSGKAQSRPNLAGGLPEIEPGTRSSR